jgi:DNA repair exonuclease SbcCD nuclease subunit
MIRFLHAADLHLDSPLRGLARYEGAPADQIRQASRGALRKFVDLAISERVHFVIIAGDVYDGDWHDVATGLFFLQQMGRLRQQAIPVYLISGNHDAANKMTRSLPYPDNVRSFPTDQPLTFRLDGQPVALHGQGYAEQKEMRNLAAAYPPPVPGCLNIGVLHTGLDGREGHDRYAPCQLDELTARGYEYWALGHIHQRESVNGERRPRVEFPGNIQGRHIREAGEKGCLLVHVDAARNLTLDFQPLDIFRWARAEVDCSGATDRETVLQAVDEKLDDLLAESGGRSLGVRLELTGCCPVHVALLAEDRRLREEIRAQAVGRGESKIWIEKIQVRTTPPQMATAEPVLAQDALSELAAVVDELRANPTLLQTVLEQEEVKHLSNRLPHEFRDGSEAVRLTDPAWAAPLLDRVQAILAHAATTKESAL